MHSVHADDSQALRAVEHWLPAAAHASLSLWQNNYFFLHCLLAAFLSAKGVRPETPAGEREHFLALLLIYTGRISPLDLHVEGLLLAIGCLVTERQRVEVQRYMTSYFHFISTSSHGQHRRGWGAWEVCKGTSRGSWSGAVGLLVILKYRQLLK